MSQKWSSGTISCQWCCSCRDMLVVMTYLTTKKADEYAWLITGRSADMSETGFLLRNAR